MMFVRVRKLVDLALIACISYPAAQTVYGQVAQRPAPPAGQVAPGQTLGNDARGQRDLGRRDDNRILQGSSLIGAPVMFQAGGNFGTLRDFVISDSGCVEYAVIGADNGLVAVPWGNGMFDVGRRAFVVDFGRDRIRDLPRFRDVADLRDAGLRGRIHTFFGNNRNGMQQHGAAFRPENNARSQNNPNEHGTANGAQRFGNPGTQGNPRTGTAPGNRGANEGTRHEK
jgi:hypothetical protein